MFIADIRNRKFKTEEELDKIVKDYYDGVILLVSFGEKTIVTDSMMGRTRYIDGSNYPYFSSRDLLAYDSLHGTAIIVIKRELVHFGDTFESKIRKIKKEE